MTIEQIKTFIQELQLENAEERAKIDKDYNGHYGDVSAPVYEYNNGEERALTNIMGFILDGEQS